MTEFNIGDRVKVISNTDPFLDDHTGATGTVQDDGAPDGLYGMAWLVNLDTGTRAYFYEGEIAHD